MNKHKPQGQPVLAWETAIRAEIIPAKDGFGRSVIRIIGRSKDGARDEIEVEQNREVPRKTPMRITIERRKWSR